MDYEICVEDEEPFLRVIVKSDVSRELATVFVTAAVAEATRLGLTRLIFDFRAAQSVDSDFSKYEFAQGLDKSGIPRHFRYAVVTDLDDDSHDFAETTILNQGFQVKFFKDMAEAESWLRG